MYKISMIIPKIYLFALLTFVTSFVHAVNIVKVDDPGLIDSHLESSLRFHVEGLENFKSKNPDQLTSSKLKKISQKWSKSTVSTFEYRYTENGALKTRVYYSLSGDTADTVAQLPISEDYPNSGVKQYAKLFNNPNSKFNATLPTQASDSELKALQTFENDIITGRIPSGGKLVGYISQEPCPSCSNLLSEQLPSSGYVSEAEFAYLPHASEGEIEARIANTFQGKRLNLIKFQNLRSRLDAKIAIQRGEEVIAGCR